MLASCNPTGPRQLGRATRIFQEQTETGHGGNCSPHKSPALLRTHSCRNWQRLSGACCRTLLLIADVLFEVVPGICPVPGLRHSSSGTRFREMVYIDHRNRFRGPAQTNYLQTLIRALRDLDKEPEVSEVGLHRPSRLNCNTNRTTITSRPQAGAHAHGRGARAQSRQLRDLAETYPLLDRVRVADAVRARSAALWSSRLTPWLTSRGMMDLSCSKYSGSRRRRREGKKRNSIRSSKDRRLEGRETRIVKNPLSLTVRSTQTVT
jgi:hypothetical protein